MSAVPQPCPRERPLESRPRYCHRPHTSFLALTPGAFEVSSLETVNELPAVTTGPRPSGTTAAEATSKLTINEQGSSKNGKAVVSDAAAIFGQGTMSLSPAEIMPANPRPSSLPIPPVQKGS